MKSSSLAAAPNSSRTVRTSAPYIFRTEACFGLTSLSKMYVTPLAVIAHTAQPPPRSSREHRTTRRPFSASLAQSQLRRIALLWEYQFLHQSVCQSSVWGQERHAHLAPTASSA